MHEKDRERKKKSMRGRRERSKGTERRKYIERE